MEIELRSDLAGDHFKEIPCKRDAGNLCVIHYLASPDLLPSALYPRFTPQLSRGIVTVGSALTPRATTRRPALLVPTS